MSIRVLFFKIYNTFTTSYVNVEKIYHEKILKKYPRRVAPSERGCITCPGNPKGHNLDLDTSHKILKRPKRNF